MRLLRWKKGLSEIRIFDPIDYFRNRSVYGRINKMKQNLIFIITIGVIVLLTANISAVAISDGKTSKILDIISQKEKIPVGQLEVLNANIHETLVNFSNTTQGTDPGTIPSIFDVTGLIVESQDSIVLTYDVGGGNNDFATMSELTSTITLQSGDGVNIYPGVYTDGWLLTNVVGTEENPIIIRGVYADGTPIDQPIETVIFDFQTMTLPNIWGENCAIQISPSCSNIVIQGITLKKFTPGTGFVIGNWGTGTIRLKNILFKENYVCYQAKGNSETTIIEFCEIDGTSTLPSSEFEHQIYTYGKDIIIKNNYFHGLLEGSSAIIKHRGKNISVFNNYIDMGNGDKALDLCNFDGPEAKIPLFTPHTSIVKNNVFIKPEWATDKYSQSFIRHAGDSTSTPRIGNLLVENNYFVDYDGSIAHSFISNSGSGNTNEFNNNVLFGVDIQVTFGSEYEDILEGTNNWIVIGANIHETLVNFSNTTQGTDPGTIPSIFDVTGLIVESQDSIVITYDVGGGNNDFATMSELTSSITLQAGDVVNIYPGVYTDTWNLTNAAGTEELPIIIRGVTANGSPITEPSEIVIFNYSGVINPIENALTAMLFSPSSSWIELEGISIQNVEKDLFIGIRVHSKGGFTARNILFKNNVMSFGAHEENDISILEYNEFYGGIGGPYGSTNFHQVYSFASDNLIVRNNYFHDFDSIYGSVIKTRDKNVEITNNHIEMGSCQNAIDLAHYEKDPNQIQNAIITGNTIIKSENQSDYSNAIIKRTEGGAHVGNVSILSNTIEDQNGCISKILDVIVYPGYQYEVSNNIITGKDILISGSQHTPADGINNSIIKGADITYTSQRFQDTIKWIEPEPEPEPEPTILNMYIWIKRLFIFL